MYYVYILANSTNVVLYIGVTNDLVRRVYEHKNHLDKGSFTDRYNVSKLVYYEQTTDAMTAIQREKQLKDRSRKFKNQLITDFNPKWRDLYPELI